MIKKSLTLFLILVSAGYWFPLLGEASPEAFEGSGPILKSRVIAQSALTTFIKSKVILSTYQYASDKIEYPVPENSIVFGAFSSVVWSDLYWTTRDYQSPIRDGFTLFSNKVFQVRYASFINENFFTINSTYPWITQNFSSPVIQ
ncbi:MAG: hypothetical protein ACUVQ0_05630 [Thermoproteota archaeon]